MKRTRTLRIWGGFLLLLLLLLVFLIWNIFAGSVSLSASEIWRILLGGDVDMTRDEYSKMRGSSVREVASTHGNISFKDVLLFHQEE